MPDSATTTSQKQSNAWPGWEIMVLHDMGAPTSKSNIAFLDGWQQYEKSKATNNPLNLTGPRGTGSINSAGVQNYATRQEGARYTAANIAHYPTIYKMLKSNSVNATLFNSGSLNRLIADLQKWGSDTFAAKLAGGKSVADKAKDKAGDIAAPFSAGLDAINWVKDNWSRILFVIGGSVLVIIGLIVLLRSNQKNTFTFERGES